MSGAYDAIVVGGGLAGLTGAAYLCRYGYRTLLCEKGHKTGGLVNSFWHQGFAFDAGIRAFENSGILFPMLNSLGLHMKFLDNPVSVGIGSQWVKLHSRDSLRDYAAMLTAVFPENAPDIARLAEEIKKVMGYMDVLYGIDNPLFLENMRDLTYLMKTLLPWLLRYQVNIRKAMRLSRPVQAYLRRFTENGALIDMVAQHFFQNTPSFFALSYFGQYLDYRYPAGGTGVLAEKMTDCILDAGGEILTRAEVINADVNLHEITLSDERTFRYKKLIWAADQKTLFSALTAPKTASIEKQQLLTENSVGGDSVLTLFLGIDLPADYFRSRCGAHAFYTATAEGLSALPKWEDRSKLGNSALLDWVGAYLSRTTYEISCPALRDEALAPEGKTGVILSTLMDCGLVRTLSETGGYEAFKAYCTEKIVKTLENSLFPGVSEHILFTICATPLTIERETSNHNGAITGWAFTNKEMPAENRFAKIAKAVFTPMEDVYQCGQWSFSPSGLPVSILTGKLAADAVHKTCGGHKR